MMHDEIILRMLPARVNADDRLCWRGRHVNSTFLLESGTTQYLISIEKGRIASVQKNAGHSDSHRFALRAGESVWSSFWHAHPAPGYHDIMALIKFKRLKAEGDLYPLMSHLLYFKDVLAAVRDVPQPAGVQA